MNKPISKLNTIIVEDETLVRKKILALLKTKKFKDKVKVLGCADCVDDAFDLITTHKKKLDLVLLDINLYNSNAFELLNKLEKYDTLNFYVIFVTILNGHDSLQKVFQRTGVYYVHKNDLEEELLKGIDKVQDTPRINLANPILIANRGQDLKEHKLAVRNSHQNYSFISLSKIIYFYKGFWVKKDGETIKKEGSSSTNYTSVFTENGEIYHVVLSIIRLEKILPNELFRKISGSAIINISTIIGLKYFEDGYEFQGQGFFVVLEGDIKLKIPNLKTETLPDWLTGYE